MYQTDGSTFGSTVAEIGCRELDVAHPVFWFTANALCGPKRVLSRAHKVAEADLRIVQRLRQKAQG